MKAATFVKRSKNAKIGEKTCATYLSIAATCPSTCAMRGGGCYAQDGNVNVTVIRLDEGAVGKDARDVAREEAHLIRTSFRGRRIPQDGARGGRDLRLHVSGDSRTPSAVRIVASAVEDYLRRGGGDVWSYTHAWRAVLRREWGRVSVLASMEDAREVAAARKRGYAPALVVAHHDSSRAHKLPGSDVLWIPCPSQVRDTTCDRCRLCMNADKLLSSGRGITFAAHGSRTKTIKRRLSVIQ